MTCTRHVPGFKTKAHAYTHRFPQAPRALYYSSHLGDIMARSNVAKGSDYLVMDRKASPLNINRKVPPKPAVRDSDWAWDGKNRFTDYDARVQRWQDRYRVGEDEWTKENLKSRPKHQPATR